MYLNKLSLLNFKNYEEANLDFSSKINCFLGDNGVGKTNILDSIYYLSMCKSYFNSTDIQNIKYDTDFFSIIGNYNRNDENEEIICGVIKSKKKVFKRNKKEYERLAEHIGLIPVVMISPYDSTLITEGSEERRNFMNSVISQYDNEYLYSLLRYNKAVVQRNKLLKDFAIKNSFDIETLEIYDEQMITYGERISKRRKEFVKNIKDVFLSYYQKISRNTEEVELIYKSQLLDADFRQLLIEARDKDRFLQYSTIGTHKDDLQMMMGGHSIKNCGSQGQQKTFLVALKFAKFEFIKQVTSIKPILLLDDIFDKFDKNRVEEIIKIVSDEHFGQIFITDTNKDRLDHILSEIAFDHKIFTIHSGKIN